MAKRPTRWTEEECERVVDVLTSFNGADEVCAVMGCDADELDRRCYQSFGESFADLMERYHTVGRVKVRQALFDSAMHGNAKALDTLAREQLGIGPVEVRRKLSDQGGSVAGDVDF